ncbi:UNVERIFIED_CONTAM: hypothetical protein Cloal_2509 [Acetivibrio alkalicellulosi]
MNEQTIYCSEFVKIYSLNDEVYFESFKPGLSMEQIYEIFSMNTFIIITDHKCLKNAVINAPTPPQKVGALKERIMISLIEEDTKATLTLNVPEEDLKFENRKDLILEVYTALKKSGIVFGIKQDLFFQELKNEVPYIIATSVPPEDGRDCIINMYQFDEPKPEIKEDGKVNFYELQLIHKVKVGDWLGERIEATNGTPGKSIFGKNIPASKGKTFPLKYDKATVYETKQDKKTVLHSKINGAVAFNGDLISVSNYLEIDGDVDFKTGNISFDGYVSVSGTVTDGFYVEATKDIEINSILGLGNVKGITSLEGNIYIKGGIASKNRAEINAKKNVYTKFVDNAIINCCGTAYIGFYCINSLIEAKEVIVESPKGSINGGMIKAEIKVSVPNLGSQLEKRTVIEVTGFNRKMLTEEMENVNNKISELKNTLIKLKQSLAKLDSMDTLTSEQSDQYNKRYQKLLFVTEEIKLLEECKKNITRYLKTKGEGEISIFKKIYPNCMLVIKNRQTEIRSPQLTSTYFVQDGEVRVI